MIRKLLSFVVVLLITTATSLSAFAADQVTFTRHAYDDGDYLFRTYMAPSNVPLATMIRPDDSGNPGVYEFILLSELVEPLYTFSVKAPENYDYCSRLEFIDNGGKYLDEILVTQHLFNDDDLYEVIFRGEDEYDRKHYVIYNEKGEYLGECPSLYIYNGENGPYLYKEYEDGSKGQNISALYSINKGGASVAKLKVESAKFQVMPNPVKEDEVVTLVLPNEITADMTIKVFSLNGSLLIQKECKQGEKEIAIPAYRLATGVNPVVAMDAEGNVICSGKIIRE